RVYGLLAAALLAIGLPQQQTTPPPANPPPAQTPQGQPIIRSRINFVSVDAIVSDKKTGEVVMDLKQDDFEVREDKKPQKIETFDTVRIDPQMVDMSPVKDIRSTYDEEAEENKPNVLLFILFLDDYHTKRGNAMAVRAPLIDFFTNQLAPQDMVAVMDPLMPVTGLTFTRNRATIVAAINHFEGRKFNY